MVEVARLVSQAHRDPRGQQGPRDLLQVLQAPWGLEECLGLMVVPPVIQGLQESRV
jgi:hypothetical protein